MYSRVKGMATIFNKVRGVVERREEPVQSVTASERTELPRKRAIYAS